MTPFTVKHSPDFEGDEYPWTVFAANGEAMFGFATEQEANDCAEKYNATPYKGSHRAA